MESKRNRVAVGAVGAVALVALICMYKRGKPKSRLSSTHFLSELKRGPVELKHELVCDRIQGELMKTIVNTMKQLVTDKLRDYCRYHMLLLSHKNVGKSTILQSIQEVCARCYANEVIICVQNCSTNTTDPLTPLGVIARALGWWVRFMRPSNVPDEVEYIEATLRSRGLRCVLLIDEFQAVYTRYSEAKYNRYITELDSILQSKSGRFFVIVTGSGENLDQIVFGKLNLPEGQKLFKNYERYSLNSTKLQPRWLHPHSRSS